MSISKPLSVVKSAYQSIQQGFFFAQAMASSPETTAPRTPRIFAPLGSSDKATVEGARTLQGIVFDVDGTLCEFSFIEAFVCHVCVQPTPNTHL
jgi:hypothetical protein